MNAIRCDAMEHNNSSVMRTILFMGIMCTRDSVRTNIGFLNMVHVSEASFKLLHFDIVVESVVLSFDLPLSLSLCMRTLSVQLKQHAHTYTQTHGLECAWLK